MADVTTVFHLPYGIHPPTATTISVDEAFMLTAVKNGIQIKPLFQKFANRTFWLMLVHICRHALGAK